MVGGGHCLVRMEWHPALVGVSASVNLPLHHKIQKFSSGTGSLGWSQKKAAKRLWRLWYHTTLSVDFLEDDSERVERMLIVVSVLMT